MSPASTSVPKLSKSLLHPSGNQVATIAAGCFWGTENIYRKQYGDKLTDLKVGYANGVTTSPSYQDVCSGSTQHAESLQISFDPSKVSYKELIQFFFLMHDPTTENRQGPDIGTQYRSSIFTFNEEEQKIAEQVKQETQKKWYPNHTIVTTVEPITNFWDAEEYHQLYLIKNPEGYECPSHFIRTTPKV
ncbi:hypothetical protein PACTADRAFT_48478 [Pachysolen tannophilus NRRL Y-2460]|uniref:peptide-methionine (S)-S-oxide reductase n=1 Tax=Pachysolen tannophilus NRRL Y-2460 TaxID=669874 RepID=A0A1E4TY30_PACTA|nr:hypothetical protein PACTADRAFT_48478 [Pachysolen tannophilus NRRL Y-2460]